MFRLLPAINRLTKAHIEQTVNHFASFINCVMVLKFSKTS